MSNADQQVSVGEGATHVRWRDDRPSSGYQVLDSGKWRDATDAEVQELAASGPIFWEPKSANGPVIDPAKVR